MQRARCDMQLATYDMQHANMRRAKKKGVTTLNIPDACNMQHATCNMQHASMQVEEGEGEGASKAIVPTGTLRGCRARLDLVAEDLPRVRCERRSSDGRLAARLTCMLHDA